MMRYFHCYLLCSVPEYIKIKPDHSKMFPQKTIQNRHASQRIPTEKNTCSDMAVPYIQVTGNSDLNFSQQ